MEPAHVPGGVVKGHIVVESGVHAPRPQPVGHRPQTQLPEGGTHRKAPQRHGGGAHAEGGDPPRAQGPGEPVALKAGKHCPQGDDHGHRPGVGYRPVKLGIHRGPGRPQQGVGQAQGDKREINDGQKQMKHK